MDHRIARLLALVLALIGTASAVLGMAKFVYDWQLFHHTTLFSYRVPIILIIGGCFALFSAMQAFRSK